MAEGRNAFEMRIGLIKVVVGRARVSAVIVLADAIAPERRRSSSNREEWCK